MMGTLKELRARKAEREAALEAETNGIELAALEAEEKAIADSGGKPGKDFSVVACRAGVFVVHKPDFIAAKRFVDAEKPGLEDIAQFASTCLRGDDLTLARTVFQEHGGVASDIAAAAISLFRAELGARRGK
jgi:hypothetical protein